jgi:hypothetical protein
MPLQVRAGLPLQELLLWNVPDSGQAFSMLWKPLPNGLMSYLKNSPKAFEVILNVFGGTSDTDSTPNPGMADYR